MLKCSSSCQGPSNRSCSSKAGTVRLMHGIKSVQALVSIFQERQLRGLAPPQGTGSWGVYGSGANQDWVTTELIYEKARDHPKNAMKIFIEVSCYCPSTKLHGGGIEEEQRLARLGYSTHNPADGRYVVPACLIRWTRIWVQSEALLEQADWLRRQ